MIRVSATIDKRQLENAAQTLKGVRNGVKRAAVRAINKVARSARTEVVRKISRETGLRQRDIRKRNVRLLRARYDRLSALLILTGRAIKLIRYRARQTRRGVTYRSGEGRKLLPSAFIATMPSGHEGVFKRRGKERLPIDEQYGSNPLDAVDVDALESKVDRDLSKEFDRQVDLLIEQAERRRNG